MAGLVLLLAVATIAVGEWMPVWERWDGGKYLSWGFGWPTFVLKVGVTRYEAQRVLPSLIVWLFDAQNPFRGFQLLDAFWLVAAAVLYARIAALLAWTRVQAWAGFAAIFGSFAIARHALYYPDLTDVTAFFLGMVIAWGYLADRPLVLTGAALAGAFTWPALPPIALALLLLPRAPFAGSVPRRARLAIAALAVLGGALVIFHFARHPVPIDEKWLRLVLGDWLWLTAILLAAMVGAGTFALIAGRPTRVRWWALLAAVVVYAARSLWVQRVGTAGPGPTGAQFACEQALEALRGPAWGPVHHVAYFGPVVVVGALRWRHLARDPGSALVLLFVLAFSVGTESRQWTHLFPLFAILVVHATTWTPRRLLVFAALTLAWSKLWWPMATGRAASSYEWPALRYFMQQGPWASNATYLAHLVAALATAAILWRATCRDA